ncbi:MAG: hypothetical protein KDA61_16175, partial [Planctomycetales bacterium]|nr:hypothetical protein [Planctomycetales bacterium]
VAIFIASLTSVGLLSHLVYRALAGIELSHPDWLQRPGAYPLTGPAVFWQVGAAVAASAAGLTGISLWLRRDR